MSERINLRDRAISTSELEAEVRRRKAEEREEEALRRILAFFTDEQLVIRFDLSSPVRGDSYGPTSADIRKVLVDGMRSSIDVRLAELTR